MNRVDLKNIPSGLEHEVGSKQIVQTTTQCRTR